MDERKRSSVPDFDKASDLRRGLTPQQRDNYDLLRLRHDEKIRAVDNQLRAREREDVIHKMQDILTQKPVPRYTRLNEEKTVDPELLRRKRLACPDHVDGKQTRYWASLKIVEKQARQEITRVHFLMRENVKSDLKREEQRFLQDCKRERQGKEGKQNAPEDRAKSAPQEREHDTSWKSAVTHAAEREKDRDRDRDHER